MGVVRINGNGLTELLWAGGVFVVLFILTLYDEKKASNSKYKISVYNKWFFYIYYPLHLMILQLLK
ncbi:MAG: TraX family protein [Thomasclavelia sp.]